MGSKLSRLKKWDEVQLYWKPSAKLILSNVFFDDADTNPAVLYWMKMKSIFGTRNFAISLCIRKKIGLHCSTNLMSKIIKMRLEALTGEKIREVEHPDPSVIGLELTPSTGKHFLESAMSLAQQLLTYCVYSDTTGEKLHLKDDFRFLDLFLHQFELTQDTFVVDKSELLTLKDYLKKEFTKAKR